MTPLSFPRVGHLLLLLASVGLCAGCENTVDPFSERGAYSVYGALSLNQDRQFIRVKPLRSPIFSDSSTSLPATVTLQNRSTGTTKTLQDSIVVFEDETVTHNYWTDLDVEPRTEYQLTVEGPAGTVQATTLTPTNTKATVDPRGHTPGPPTDTVDENSDKLHCLTLFEVRFLEAKVPYQARVRFMYEGVPVSVTRPISEFRDGTMGFRFSPNGLLAEVEEEPSDNPATCRFHESRCEYLSSGELTISYTYLGPEWFGNRPSDYSGNGFDPTLSGKIQGGLGFFGSYFRGTPSVTIHRGIIDLGPDACGPP